MAGIGKMDLRVRLQIAKDLGYERLLPNGALKEAVYQCKSEVELSRLMVTLRHRFEDLPEVTRLKSVS